MNIYINTIKTLVKRFPAVIPGLTGRARWIAFALKFSEDQPRDESGRWTDGGGGDSGGSGDGGGDGGTGGGSGDVESNSDGTLVFRGEFIKLKDKVLENGLKGKAFDGREKSVYATTSEEDAHLYGVQKSGSDFDYAVVAIRVPPGYDFVPDERDTKPVYGRKNAIRIPGNVPASWIVSVKSYHIPETMEGQMENDIASYMYQNKSSEKHVYAVILFNKNNKKNYKTYDYFLQQIERLITSVYNGNLGGEFIDVMANLISGQLTQAFEQAWKDEDGEGELPDYLSSALEDMILNQYDFVDGLYRDIVDARVDETPIEPLLSRAGLWANRWNEAYDRASSLITMENGGNEEWVLGETEEHCWICRELNGIVARASEWDELGVHPQGAPNPILSLENDGEKGCGGWHCDCKRQATDKRRSPKAYESIMNIVSK